jgi:hypothetical protein
MRRPCVGNGREFTKGNRERVKADEYFVTGKLP